MVTYLNCPNFSHEIDHEEAASEKIKATFQMMGFSIEDNNIPKGQMVFRKRMARLRPPRYKNTKRFGRKTYFDEDGNSMKQVNHKFLSLYVCFNFL